MSTTITERPTGRPTGRPTEEPTDIWVCPNCRTETEGPRKRCTDCGTSRY